MPPPAPDEPAEPSARPGRRRQLAALALGALLLCLVLQAVGLGPVLARLRLLRWTAPLVLLPYAVETLLDTLGWRRTLPAAAVARVPFAHLCLVRMAGEAVNGITPTATLGGEAVKAQLLRRFGVAAADGMASVVIARTAMTASQIAFILMGVAALFDRLGQRRSGAAFLGGLTLLGIGFTLVLVRLQRRAPATAAARWLRRLAPRSALLARLEPKAVAMDGRLADFYRLEPRAFAAATLWHLAGWLVGVLEVQLLAYLIGFPLGLGDALLIEALSQPVRAAALVIPGALGVQEAGGAALCGLLGIPAAVGVTLFLLKRARETVYDALGVLYLTRHAARRI